MTSGSSARTSPPQDDSVRLLKLQGLKERDEREPRRQVCALERKR